jgi:putative oxidoreductase
MADSGSRFRLTGSSGADADGDADGMPTSFDLGAWLPRIGVAMFFVLVVGVDKLSSNPHGPWVKTFDQIGFGQWFRYVTGAIQVSGGLLFLFRRTMALGALLLGATMVGAAMAQIFFLHSPGSAVIPAALLVLILLVWRRTVRGKR